MAGGQSFPRQARLLTGGAFRRVFSGAERVADAHFTVLAAANQHGRPRLGLAVGRRVATRAVDRNRIKRIARESFRHHQQELPPVDLVLVARPRARGASRARLHRGLENLWQQVAKRCDDSLSGCYEPTNTR
ncbi:MAG: ribonuclease P protein component [Ectothiorhodospiraceae bacterium]